MLKALVTALLVGQLSPGLPRVEGPIFVTKRSTSIVFAQFEFAPASGTGMGSECACTTPTGAKGETMTFTRASAATCTKGTNSMRTTGISNGDIVYCSTNQPRVERDVSGVLGLRIENTATNKVLRSQEFDNAAWTTTLSGTPPVFGCADCAIAPDGTLTADRVDFPAATGSNYAFWSQANVGAAGQPVANKVYVRAASGSCDINVGTYPGGVNNFCTTTTAVSTEWRLATNVTASQGGQGYMLIGTAGGTGCVGSTATNACSVYLWGAQLEDSTYSSAYIPTTSAAVTRATDLAYFAYGTTNTSGSLSCNVQFPTTAADKGWVGAAGSVSFRTMLYEATAGAVTQYVDAVNRGATSTTIGGSRKLAMSWSGGASQVCNDGACVATTAATESGAVVRIDLLQYGADITKTQDGIINRICYDPVTTRCAP